MELEQVLEESMLIAMEPAFAAEKSRTRVKSKELSHSSSTSTICPESDDSLEGNMDHF